MPLLLVSKRRGTGGLDSPEVRCRERGWKEESMLREGPGMMEGTESS